MINAASRNVLAIAAVKKLENVLARVVSVSVVVEQPANVSVLNKV